MSINIDNKAWDSYRDKLDYFKWDNEGVAELWRIYTMNGSQVYKHIPNDDKDKDIIPYPIKAKGITAFLANENVFSLANLIRGKWNRNALTFYKTYYDRCISNLKRREINKSSLAFINYSEIELIKQHIKSEKQLFNESKCFYNEIFKSTNEDELLSERNTLDEIKEVALFYPEWVKNTHLNDQNISNKSKALPVNNKPGRPNSNPKPIKEYFTNTLTDPEIDNLLNVLKVKSQEYKPIQFVFMIKALEDLGHINFHENIEIFSAFEDFIGKTYGHISGKNNNMRKAIDGSKKELLLIRMKSIIKIIIEENRLKN